MALTYKDTKKQSLAVFGQFGESKWIPFAKENAKLPRRDIEELKGAGIGKFLVNVAMGASLEQDIEILKKYREKVDIVTCDKGFPLLLDHGIKADYVMICDCNVLFDRVKNYINESVGVKLICTPYANLEWTSAWKGDRYFFVNKDSIQTEKVFLEIFGKGMRVIPAGSNVSNAMVIFFIGVDEYSRINWGGYEKIFLTGYDYSWQRNGNYYAFSNPIPKRYYMTHRTILDKNGEWVFTSENLFFSAQWLLQYARAYDLPMVNCSRQGILTIPNQGNMENELKKINNSGILRDIVKSSYGLAVRLKRDYDDAIQNLNKTREALSWQ